MKALELQNPFAGLTRVSAACVALTTVDAATVATVLAQQGGIQAVFIMGVGCGVVIPGFVNDGGDVVHVMSIDDTSGTSSPARWYPDSQGHIIVLVDVPGAFTLTHYHIPLVAVEDFGHVIGGGGS